MTQTNLLMTQLTLTGTFHNVSLYSGILYLWTDPKTVRLYHWKKWMDHLSLHRLPIYLEPYPLQTMTQTINDLEPYFMKEINFEYAVRDFTLFRHQLYFIHEEGLYKVDPESAHLVQEKLVSGNFHSISLSKKNRFALASLTDGIYEYIVESNETIHWNEHPTASVYWDEHHLLQMDEHGEPFQRIDFEQHRGKSSIARIVKKEILQPHESYYHPVLDLMDENDNQNWMPLFEYLPPQKTTSSEQTTKDNVSLHVLPHPFLRSAILRKDTLYMEEKEDGLYLIWGEEPYLHLTKNQYESFHIYPKSRNYQNHLHLVTNDRMNFLIFYQLR